jgi:hypothetical protein
MVIRFRSRETEDAIDESLLLWRDTQASRFASAIHDPQRMAFPQMQRQLMEMESCLDDLSRTGERSESGAARVRADYEPVMSLCASCENKVRSADYYVSDARVQADTAMTRANGIRTSVAALGLPPV